MSAYFIARVNIWNREKYKEYLRLVTAIIQKYEGKTVVRTEQPVTMEGKEENRRIIILEFPSVEKAKEFYNSSEYSVAKSIRKEASEGEVIIVETIN